MGMVLPMPPCSLHEQHFTPRVAGRLRMSAARCICHHTGSAAVRGVHSWRQCSSLPRLQACTWLVMRQALVALALTLLCRSLVTAEPRRVNAVSVPNCTRLQGQFVKSLRIALGWAGNLRLVFTCSQSARPHFASYLAALRSLDVLSCLAPICPSRSPHNLFGIRVSEAVVCGT